MRPKDKPVDPAKLRAIQEDVRRNASAHKRHKRLVKFPTMHKSPGLMDWEEEYGRG